MARALVIDDEKNILDILRTLLVKLDFKVKVAHDGREGIELFEDGHDFDLVITDIRMPRVDGNQVAKHIRGSSYCQMLCMAELGSVTNLLYSIYKFNISNDFTYQFMGM